VSEVLLGDTNAVATAVRFGLANWVHYVGGPVQTDTRSYASRLELTAGAHRLRLDQVADDWTPDWQEVGYRAGITHIGELTRADGTVMSYAEARGMLEAIFFWASLLRGAYSAPITAIGRGPDSEALWTQHAAWHVDPWSNDHGALPWPIATELDESKPTVEALGRSLNRVAKLLEDEQWKETLGRAILWLCTANTGQTDGDLILAQAGLELLAYVIGTRRGLLTDEAFTKLTAADTIQLALTTLGISLDIPVAMQQLSTYAAGRQLNAAQAVAQIRNTVVHPPTSQKQRHKDLRDHRLKIQAKRLALTLLERALLRICDYDGAVWDRAVGRATVSW